MKIVHQVIRILISLFLIVAITVHIVGLFSPISDEPLWSHIVHLISYSLCLFTFLREVRFRLLLYFIGTIYPVAYHAHCFATQLLKFDKFNAICFLVIVILPLAALVIWQNKTARLFKAGRSEKLVAKSYFEN